MRLIKRPVEKRITKAIIETKWCTIARDKVTRKDYQVQTVDGFIQKIKLCIGKPDYTDQKTKRIFGSKVKGVFYDVFANVCKTPTSTLVVGVRIVDTILKNELDITGSNFTKEDGVLQFIDRVHMVHVGEGLLREV